MGIRRWTVIAGIALLAGCATREAPNVATLAQPVAPPRPALPASYVPPAATPALGADGRYLTPNRDMSAADTVWHVRSALNVAALACRGPDEAAFIAGYNALLKQQSVPLAKAYKTVQADERKAGGDWETRHDVAMTRLYNFFAQPFAQAGFCAQAGAVLAEATAVTPAGFESFAPTALDRLEAPFLAAFAASTAYRQQLAAWDAAYGPAGSGAPQLAYADIGRVMDWTSEPRALNQRLASAR